MDVVKAHRHSIHHRSEIEASNVCGYFYCLEIFPPSTITEWTDKDADTALCPMCGIDAVIGSASGAPINAQFLRSMQTKWF